MSLKNNTEFLRDLELKNELPKSPNYLSVLDLMAAVSNLGFADVSY